MTKLRSASTRPCNIGDGDGETPHSQEPRVGNTLLRYNSSHPVPLKRSIPFRLYLCIRQICSNTNDFLRQANGLRERLRLRGYSKAFLKKAFHHALSLSWEQLLFKDTLRAYEDQVRRIMT